MISSRQFSFKHYFCLLCALLFLSEKIFALKTATEQQSISLPLSSQPSSPSALASSSLPEEAKIPVRLESAKKDTGEDNSWLRMVGSLIIVGFLGVGTFVFIKRIKRTGRSSSLVPEIKILAQHYLGPKKSLVIVRLAGDTMLLGVTEKNINLIKSLSLLDEDLPDEVPKNFNKLIPSQNESLEEFPEKDPKNSLEQDEESLSEDVSISGIKDVVTSRLKNMRIL